MRQDVEDKLSRLPLKFYDSRTHGEIMSRFFGLAGGDIGRGKLGLLEFGGRVGPESHADSAHDEEGKDKDVDHD